MPAKSLNLIIWTAFAFGSSLIASRFGLSEFTPLGYVALRLALAAAGFLLLYAVKYQPWPRQKRFWKHVFVIGLLGTGIPMYAFTATLLHMSSGLTSIFSASGPALTVLMAHFLLQDERLNGRKSVGIIIALTGTILLIILGENGLPDLSGGQRQGYLLVSLALLCISANTIYVRKFLSGFPSFQVTSIQVIVGAAVILPAAAAVGQLTLAGVTWRGVGVLFYGGLVGTLIAFWLYTRLIQEHGATLASLTNYIIPVIATLGGVLLLNETFTWGMAAGVALILSGIAVLNFGFSQNRSQLPAAEAGEIGD